LRRDKDKFAARGAEILITGPGTLDEFRDYWKRKDLSFTALPDPDHRLSALYGQKWGWFKRHRLPSVVVIDREGQMRLRHDGSQMWDIPTNKEVLELLTSLPATPGA
jgi:peroxiredoxin